MENATQYTDVHLNREEDDSFDVLCSVPAVFMDQHSTDPSLLNLRSSTKLS